MRLNMLKAHRPTSILIGALCVGILSYTYKSLAGFAPDATLKPMA